MFASYAVGHEFKSQSGHTKLHHENGTKCLPSWHAGITAGVQPDSVKGRKVCETVYVDMYSKGILGSIARVGYCTSVPDFDLVHSSGLINQSIISREYDGVLTLKC